VALVRTDVSEERIACIIKMKIISNPVTNNAVTSPRFRFTMMMQAIRSPETAVLTLATRRYIQKVFILYYNSLHKFPKLVYYTAKVNLHLCKI
jgi:hypothetical protein